MDRHLRTMLGSTRPAFLLLPPVCVLLGAASVHWSGHRVDAVAATGVLVGALAAHASVNMLNEWSDFRTGLDLMTGRTPFSGGSGALPAHPQGATGVLAGALALLALCGGIGIWLLATRGLALAPLGLLGMALVVGYTPWITRRPLLCLFAPGLGFGPLMVVGTSVALGGGYSAPALAASLVPLSLVSGLLFLNQFPDVEPDRKVGRRHIPMLWGRPRAARLFAALALAPTAVVVTGVAAAWFPPGGLLAFLLLPLAVGVARGALRDADNLPALVSTMGRNVALTLLTPLALAVGGWVWP